jgi:hypothetical protein
MKFEKTTTKNQRLTDSVKKSLLILFLIFLFFPNQVLAQATSSNNVDLVIDPPTIYLTVRPGESIVHRVAIKQNGVLPLKITPRLVSFTTDGKTGQPQLKNDTDFKQVTLSLPKENRQVIDQAVATALGQDKKLDFNQQSSESNTTNKTKDASKTNESNETNHTTENSQADPFFTLAPGQQKAITVTFSPPKVTAEKEYPLSLLFFAEPLNSFQENTSQTIISGSIASNIVLLVSQSDQDRGQLSVEKIELPLLIDSLRNLSFKILIKNLGINATNASGSVAISDWRGKKVAQYYFFPDMILSNSTRLLRNIPQEPEADLLSMTSQEAQSFLESINLEQITHNFNFDSVFLLGPYTITAKIFENGQNQVLGSSTNSSGSSSNLVSGQNDSLSENLGDNHKTTKNYDSQSGMVTKSITIVALPYSIIAVLLFLFISWILIGTFKSSS